MLKSRVSRIGYVASRQALLLFGGDKEFSQKGKAVQYIPLAFTEGHKSWRLLRNEHDEAVGAHPRLVARTFRDFLITAADTVVVPGSKVEREENCRYFPYNAEASITYPPEILKTLVDQEIYVISPDLDLKLLKSKGFFSHSTKQKKVLVTKAGKVQKFSAELQKHKIYHEAKNIWVQGKSDTGLTAVVQDILKEKTRHLVFLDGWQTYVKDAVAENLGIEQIPQTHLLLAIHNGKVESKYMDQPFPGMQELSKYFKAVYHPSGIVNIDGSKTAYAVLNRLSKEEYEQKEKTKALSLVEQKALSKEERAKRNAEKEKERQALKKYLTKFRNPKGDV